MDRLEKLLWGGEEKRVGRRKIRVTQRFKRRDVVEGQVVRVRKVWAGKFRRYAGWKAADYVKLFGIVIRDLILKNIGNLGLLILGIGQTWFRFMFEGKPDVIFLKGGFVGVPVGIVAGWLKIPYIVHESDATPGLANRMLKRKAKIFATGVKGALAEDEQAKSQQEVFVGIPIGEEFKKVNELSQRKLKKELGFREEQILTVVVGGSQGSVHLNESIVKILPNLLEDTQVGLVSGKGNYRETIAKAREKLGESLIEEENVGTEPPELIIGEKTEEQEENESSVAQKEEKMCVRTKQGETCLEILDYCTSLEKMLGAADIVVSRAGATMITNLAKMEKATILVPFEALPGGQQTKNAKILEQSKAALVLPDEVMMTKPNTLLKLIRELAKDSEARKNLAQAIKKLNKDDAAKELAELIIGVGKGQ